MELVPEAVGWLVASCCIGSGLELSRFFSSTCRAFGEWCRFGRLSGFLRLEGRKASWDWEVGLVERFGGVRFFRANCSDEDLLRACSMTDAVVASKCFALSSKILSRALEVRSLEVL